MDFQIRPAQALDKLKILEINQGVVVGPWTLLQIEQEMAKDHSRSLVIEDRSGTMAGFIFYQDIAGDFEILLVAVDKPFQGQGLGRRLLEGALMNCTPGGFVYLEVSEKNLPAMALYQSVGFQEIGRRPHYYKDGSAAINMKLKLAKT